MQDYLDVLARAVRNCMPQDRPVSQAPAAAELAKTLDVRINDERANLQSLEDAVRAYLHYNPAVYKSNFHKLLYSGLNKPALLGDWITSLSNANMHTYQMSPVPTLMELELKPPRGSSTTHFPVWERKATGQTKWKIIAYRGLK